jgi:hypothetical protein
MTGGPTRFNPFPDFPKPVQICKFKTDAFRTSKNSQILHEAILEHYTQRSQLCRLQIPNKNHAKNLGTDSIFEFSMNFKGVQTFWENLINSPKFSLDLIFTKLNLVGHTCM